jgi:hypothetical protein
MASPLMTKEACAHVIREFAAMVEHSKGDVSFELHAKRYPVITKEKLMKREEALRNGYVLDITTPLTVDITYDSRAIGGVGWPE